MQSLNHEELTNTDQTVVFIPPKICRGSKINIEEKKKIKYSKKEIGNIVRRLSTAGTKSSCAKNNMI